jgi:hypothetical protein
MPDPAYIEMGTSVTKALTQAPADDADSQNCLHSGVSRTAVALAGRLPPIAFERSADSTVNRKAFGVLRL